ncbi:unnamed protein product [Miscanthus lutarioriparius]|uniref:Uncharacterized protein n=1 Tax=Miscanthus lutarioriparius TaxID=422564 RepID=A0A811P939_9POAL|nr:unnamed protein product [Miscanthus lutarioriparius]
MHGNRRRREHLLDEWGWVRELHPATIDRKDYSVFRLKAWCSQPELIPTTLDLDIVEPPIQVEDFPPVKRALRMALTARSPGAGCRPPLCPHSSRGPDHRPDDVSVIDGAGLLASPSLDEAPTQLSVFGGNELFARSSSLPTQRLRCLYASWRAGSLLCEDLFGKAAAAARGGAAWRWLRFCNLSGKRGSLGGAGGVDVFGRDSRPDLCLWSRCVEVMVETPLHATRSLPTTRPSLSLRRGADQVSQMGKAILESPSRRRSRFMKKISKRIEKILPTPRAPKPRARSHTFAAPPRRSRRIAGVGPESPSGAVPTRYRKRVMTVLNVVNENDGIHQDVLDAYGKLFGQPLPESHVQALAALFGWATPDVGEGVILSMLGSVFSHWVVLPAVGASGGILLAWRQDLGPATASRVDEHSISVQFSPAGLQPWWLTCVYGPQGDERKILFLQELRNVRFACQGPWSVLGDFNLITNAEDKNNGILNRAMMGRFRRLINELELKELPLQASATLTLAELWLALGSSHAKKALSLIYQSLPMILGHGGLELRTRAHIVLAKCHLADPKFSVLEDPEAVLDPLNQATEDLQALEYHEMAAEAYYLKAMAYNHLGKLDEREEAAARFKDHVTALENPQNEEDSLAY